MKIILYSCGCAFTEDGDAVDVEYHEKMRCCDCMAWFKQIMSRPDIWPTECWTDEILGEDHSER